MNLPRNSKGEIPDWIKFALTLFIALASVIYSYAALTERVVALSEKHDMLRAEVEAHDTRLVNNDAAFTEIKVQLAEIQRDILYIKQSLERGE
jgi:hypothetical protein